MRNIWDLVDVNLDEFNFASVALFFRQLGKDRGYRLTGAAPDGKKVDEDDFVGRTLEEGLKGDFTVNLVNTLPLFFAGWGLGVEVEAEVEDVERASCSRNFGRWKATYSFIWWTTILDVV